MQMILFAVAEPKLYQMIWMSENKKSKSFDDGFPELGETATVCIDVLRKDYELTEAEAWGQRTCYIADPEGNLTLRAALFIDHLPGDGVYKKGRTT